MVYRLRVIGEEEWTSPKYTKLRNDCPTLWDNFCDAQFTEALNRKSTDQHPMYNTLENFNAVNVHGQPFVDFETEEDAIAFKIKFG